VAAAYQQNGSSSIPSTPASPGFPAPQSQQKIAYTQRGTHVHLHLFNAALCALLVFTCHHRCLSGLLLLLMVLGVLPQCNELENRTLHRLSDCHHLFRPDCVAISRLASLSFASHSLNSGKRNTGQLQNETVVKKR